MRKGIHPKFYNDAKFTCVCGSTFIGGSTKQTIHVEVCNSCHPLYTGEQKFVDVRGRVDIFEKKRVAAKEHKAKNPQKKSGDKNIPEPKSLRELLGAA